MKLNGIAAAVFSASVLLTGVGNVQANVIDLTASKDLSGAGNGAVFSNPSNLTVVGSGAIDPFLRIQRGGSGGPESGFNTDGPVSLDTKPGPTFTHSITLGEIGTITGDGLSSTVLGTVYRQFFVDINEPNAANQRFLSLDALKFRVGNSASPANFTQIDAGDLVFDLDTGVNGNVTVLMDANFFAGSGLGYDLKFLIPDTAFFGRSSTDFVTLFATFGATTGFATDFQAHGGFEEIASLRAIPVNCPPGSTDPRCSPLPNEIPEPGTLALLGLALLGAASARRRKQ